MVSPYAGSSSSGWHYLPYAQECTLAYSKLFAEVILGHLRICVVSAGRV